METMPYWIKYLTRHKTFNPTNKTVLTSRSQTVNVGQQLGFGNSWVSHQADVYVALRQSS